MIRSRTGVILFISGILFTLVILAGIYFTATRIIWKGSRIGITSAQSKEPEQKKDENKQILVKAFAVAQKIEKNEEISEAKVRLVAIPRELLPADAIINPDSLKGKKAAVSMEPNTILSESLLYSISQELKETERLRDYEMSAGLVGGLVTEDAYIDIEFINPRGDTYVVLSKKQVKKKLDNNRIILLLSQDERKLINYALAEQKVSGGTIEAVVYSDERQPAPKPDYPIPRLDKVQTQPQPSQQPVVPREQSPQPQSSSADAPLKGGN